MEEEKQRLVPITNPKPESMVAVTLGRALNALLSARPKKLHDAVARFSPSSNAPPLGSLEESLWFLYHYVQETAERNEPMDQIIVPMIEHSLLSKESKRGGQVLILLSWLFQDEFLFTSLMRDLVSIISVKEDRYIALGWCTLVRELAECDRMISQFSLKGLRENYSPMIVKLCPCLSHLLSIMSKRSILRDGYELPSRLSVTAADCFLAITEALTRNDDTVKNNSVNGGLNASKESVPSRPDICDKKIKEIHKMLNTGMGTLLWDQLTEIIKLAMRLLGWSRKSRPLHASGLERVVKWLQDLKEQYGCLQEEADMKILKARELLLSSCWKHYCALLHLEEHDFLQNCRERLGKFLSGIQLYAERSSYKHSEHSDGAAETRNFFLNCICLLLGRLAGKNFESIMSEYGLQISEVLLSQLNSGDEDVTDQVICIFKETIFKLNYSSEGDLIDTRQMDAVLPILLQLLDERDGTARAVIILVAEYCSMSVDGECLKEVLDRVAHGNNLQQRNAIDVVSEIIQISLKSEAGLPHLAWQDISRHLIGCLESGDPVIREVTISMLPMIEPSFVLPPLVRLLCSSDGAPPSSVRDAFLGVLKYHNQEPKAIIMLLDSLSNLGDSLEFPKTSGPKFDADKVLKLTTKWSDNVQDWKVMAGPLIDKLFNEPSNAILIKFLSYISEHLADVGEIVLSRVLKRMLEQEELASATNSHDDSGIEKSLFERLCPLLIIRLLPLRIFNSLNSSILYGLLHHEGHAYDSRSSVHDNCVAALLLKRAFSKSEFEDVRKLAAELCGRIHPKVLFPIVCRQLEDAIRLQDVKKIKAGLFSLCTSLVVRGKDTTVASSIISMQTLLEEILSWPSLDRDEVSKTQHGCIDFLALLICAELQSSSGHSKPLKMKIADAGAEGVYHSDSTLSYVISRLGNNNYASPSLGPALSISFRLCMANVLISACQKINDSGKLRLARKTVPVLIRSSEVIADQEIRAACLQILFSAVYHLKSAVAPYSSDLIKLSLQFLREGTDTERMASAKLLASLMASEDPILESISASLLEARSVLSTMSRTDPSPEVRKTCQKLLLCLSPS